MKALITIPIATTIVCLYKLVIVPIDIKPSEGLWFAIIAPLLTSIFSSILLMKE